MDLSLLDAYFPEDEIEWRAQRSGMNRQGNPYVLAVPFISNRAIMKRLDEACGKANWRNEYRRWISFDETKWDYRDKVEKVVRVHGILCGISIFNGGEWITKWDGAQQTEIEGTKGGLSDSMKRAAVQWGIGRYLYYLNGDMWGEIAEQYKGRYRARIDNNDYWWNPPRMPPEFLPPAGGRKPPPPKTDDRMPDDRRAYEPPKVEPPPKRTKQAPTGNHAFDQFAKFLKGIMDDNRARAIWPTREDLWAYVCSAAFMDGDQLKACEDEQTFRELMQTVSGRIEQGII